MFWGFISFYFISFGLGHSNYKLLVRINFIFLPIEILTTYALIYLILPNYFANNKLLVFLRNCLLIIILYEIISLSIENAFQYLWPGYLELPIYIRVISTLKSFIIINTPAALIKSFKRWNLLVIEKKELEKKNLENKMSILASQLHPHFLFNTLNNLYTISINESPKVSKVIIKLSNVMRYILDDYNKINVKLTNELEIINSYIEIEKLRYDNNLKVEINYNIKDKYLQNIEIPPLLLFTLIENAFKHGVSNTIKNPWFRFNISTFKDILKVEVSNSYEKVTSMLNETRKGVGLTNLKSRLQLYYPHRNKLNIIENNDQFKVNLEIKIKI